MTFFIDTPFSLHMVFGSPGHFVEPPTVWKDWRTEPIVVFDLHHELIAVIWVAERVTRLHDAEFIPRKQAIYINTFALGHAISCTYAERANANTGAGRVRFLVRNTQSPTPGGAVDFLRN
jgi:hypothetical protein